jgi:hypothetical protein
MGFLNKTRHTRHPVKISLPESVQRLSFSPRFAYISVVGFSSTGWRQAHPPKVLPKSKVLGFELVPAPHGELVADRSACHKASAYFFARSNVHRSRVTESAIVASGPSACGDTRRKYAVPGHAEDRSPDAENRSLRMVWIDAARSKDVAGEQGTRVGALLPDNRRAHPPAINRMAQNQKHSWSVWCLPKHQ